ncbi:glucokinase [Fistulifera solaris]|jgi:glucokinase|uniref:Glucokinase n=1 Tax=Fistulifera solaris TaxID=1519565 RepID=A0A1Z5JGH4_FISSO|nr:glucokinase [Fistulifera solaris]|eukprot:GAX13103.1 glucokinase [Fistulifera solaris]
MTKFYLLTGDIGGTNSRISLYDPAIKEPLFVHFFRNAEHLPEKSLSDPNAFAQNILTPFLRDHCGSIFETGESIAINACLASAGLVQGNAVRLTNLGNLLIDGNAIASSTTNRYLESIVSCRIVNDFVAQGYGCLTLTQDEVIYLSGPYENLQHLPEGPKVCVGAGTGLGECYLTPSPSGYVCHPSEGGHVEYAPRSELQQKLWSFLCKKFQISRVSVERVVSGTGLVNVYEFLTNTFYDKIDMTLHKEFEKTDPDQRARVVATGAHNDSQLAKQAMQILMQAYGAEVGSSAIKWIPHGGLFVTGGLTPKNLSFVKGPDFMDAYRDKGRVSPLLEKIPLFAVLGEDLGIRGVHKVALQEYEQSKGRMPAKPETASRVPWMSYTLIGLLGAASGIFLSRTQFSKKILSFK